ncbi:hypothetical protein HWV62_43299 [Athelia sp. TMB]|nr:hypothetical protein HWV62_43299 [Athelia sp. TMB]
MPLDKRRWTSASELPWLVACIPEYLEAQKKSKYHKFWAPFFEQYFTAYPVRDATEADQSDSGSESDCDSDAPLDTEEEEVFSTTAAGKRKQKTKKTKANKRAKRTAQTKNQTREQKIEGRLIAKRKKQLKTWMRWHSEPARPGRRRKGSGFFGMPALGKSGKKKGPGRVSQLTEIYINLYYPTRMLPIVNKRLEDVTFTGRSIDLIRQVAREMYAEEDEETRAAVEAVRATQQQGMVENADDEDSEGEGEPTPQEYQHAIDTIHPYIESMLKELMERTGLCASLIMGGPIPSNGGKIAAISYHMGKNAIGSSFGVAHQAYSTDIVRPYTDFLRNVYPRSLKSSPTVPAGDMLTMDFNNLEQSDTCPETLLVAPSHVIVPLMPADTHPTVHAAATQADLALPASATLPDRPPAALIATNVVVTRELTPPPIGLRDGPPLPHRDMPAQPSSFATPSPRLNRIAQNSAPAGDGDGDGVITATPPRPKPKPAYKTALVLRAAAELKAREELKALAAAAAPIAEGTGTIIPPSITITAPIPIASNLIVPSRAATIEVPTAITPTLTESSSDVASINPDGRPRRAITLTPAAEQIARCELGLWV